MYKRLRAPSPAFVISLIALFVALGGTTYAATSLPTNSVGTKQLKKNAVTSAKISDHTLQKHDLSGKLIRSLRGANGPAGPQGENGATGAQGATGVLDTKMFAGPLPDEIPATKVEPSWGSMVGPTVIITTTATQKLVGSAVAVFGSTQGTKFWFGLCYQASGATGPTGFAGWNVAEADSTPNKLPYAAAATVTPGAGTWQVGYCVNNLGSNFPAQPANPLNNNGSVNGWVQVVN
jgi:hypothetical protein